MSQLTLILLVSAAVLSIGAVVGLTIFRRKVRGMSLLEFGRRLLRGGGVRTVTSRQLEAQLAEDTPPTVIDLREPRLARRGMIPTAENLPFDDFLKSVVVDGRFADDKGRALVLVCDHGNVSRVAGDVLAKDEGFTNIRSVRGGMMAWHHLQRRKGGWWGCCRRAPRASA